MAAPKAIFRDFCNSTTYHGWLFVGDDTQRGTVDRFLWFLLTLGMTCLGTVLMWHVHEDYELHKTMTTYGLKSIGAMDQMFFPAVTLCNLNLARRSSLAASTGYDIGHDDLTPFLDYIFRGLDEEGPVPEMVQKVLTDHRTKLEGLKIWHFYSEGGHPDKTLRDFINANQGKEESSVEIDLNQFEDSLDLYRLKSVQRLSQSNVLSASYNGKILKVTDFGLLHPFLDTDYGYCTYIRPQVLFAGFRDIDGASYEHLLDHHRYPVVPGIPFARNKSLYLMLDLETFDYGESSSSSDGIEISLQYPLDFPVVKTPSLNVRPGFETTVSLYPKVQETTFTAIDKFTPSQRGCISQGEIDFGIMATSDFRYSFDNCLVESAFQQVERDCGCRRATGRIHLVPKNTSEAQGRKIVPKTAEGCYGAKLKCYRKTWRNLGTNAFIHHTDGNHECRSACKDVIFPIRSVSESAFPSFRAMQDNPKLYCRAFRKMYAMCKHLDPDYKKEDIYEKKRAEALENYFKFKYGNSKIRHATVNCARIIPARQKEFESYPICTVINFELRKHGVCLHYDPEEPMVIDELDEAADKDLRQINHKLLVVDKEVYEPKADAIEWCQIDPVCIVNKKCESYTMSSITHGYKVSKRPSVIEIVFNYSRDNMAGVRIMMSDLSVRESTRDEKRPIAWLVADIGALIASTTGASLVTVMEIIFFLAGCFYWQFFGKRDSMKSEIY